jgi:hypothetical protein
MRAPALPWWRPPYPTTAEPRPTFADWWDALFGRMETFYRVELDGSWCIVDTPEVPDWLQPDLEGYAYVITTVRMTRRQFNNLPEFDGF